MAGLEIVRIPVLADNYAWLLHDLASGKTAVVDPGEADPVIAAADARGWTIGDVWITHWHPDHTGGNAALKARGARIFAPIAEQARIPTMDEGIAEGDVLRLGSHRAEVWHVPGHTAGHLAFYIAAAQALFTGDTLFAMGCGRLFEGTAEQMWANFRRYVALPDETRVYCGHEYTEANAHFAAAVAPDDSAIADRQQAVRAARAAGEATVPTTIALERATNPFMQAPTAAAFAELRAAKDAFS